MADIKKETKAVVMDLTKGLTTDQLLEYLFKSRIVDERLCKIALIRRRYYQLFREDKNITGVEAKFICEEEFGVSQKFVEHAIYRYRRVDFETGL